MAWKRMLVSKCALWAKREKSVRLKKKQYIWRFVRVKWSIWRGKQET
jgi:hypothetical protein